MNTKGLRGLNELKKGTLPEQNFVSNTMLFYFVVRFLKKLALGGGGQCPASESHVILILRVQNILFFSLSLVFDIDCKITFNLLLQIL